jgi:hypothetical protein
MMKLGCWSASGGCPGHSAAISRSGASTVLSIGKTGLEELGADAADSQS